MSAATPVQKGRVWIKAQALKLKGNDADDERRRASASDEDERELSARDSAVSEVPGAPPSSTSGGLLPALQLPPASPAAATSAKGRSVSSPPIVSSPPPIATPTGSKPGQTRQRPALKIRVVTWNMAESIPKGDLSVLLGKVPPFVAPHGWDVEDGEVDVTTGETANPSQPTSLSGLTHAVAEGIQAGKAAIFPKSDQKHKPVDERIPPLPLDDQHPFHIFVVAAQECPFGDAGRLATGVGMAGELGGLGRTKSKAHKDKEKDKLKTKSSKHSREADVKAEAQVRHDTADKSDTSAPPSQTASPRTPAVANGGEYFGLATHANASMDALAPLPPPVSDVAKVDRTVKGFGGKPGWSDLCENWLCASRSSSASKWPSGVAKAASTDGVRDSPSSSLAPGIPHHLLGLDKSASTSRLDGDTHLGSDADTTPRAEEENFLDKALRSGSTASAQSLESGAALHPSELRETATSPDPSAKSPRKKLQVLNLQIPTSASKKSLLSPSSASTTTPTAKSPGFSAMSRLQSNSSSLSGRHPSLSGTSTPLDNTPANLGPYALVAKERMMGVYLAVYCWKGCRDRVEGSSKAYVKSGLLAGRVGNKGAVGISMKLGGTRLLFVNAHLAAHEGKVATRLQNVARIKAELDCDTFLPSDDPRNMSEDVTARFDHVFWFGDLNFRIDITRQHADWLLLNKNYPQALEFDQLRKVMKDGTSNAFEGFQEAPITFPPTYKFDILSTLKKVKRSKTITKRILHRRHGSKEKVPEIEVSDSLKTEGISDPTPEQDCSEMETQTTRNPVETGNLAANGVCDTVDDDASSISSGWGSIGSLNFPYAFDTESEDHLPPPTAIERSCGDAPPFVPELVPESTEATDPNTEAKGVPKDKALLKKVKGLFRNGAERSQTSTSESTTATSADQPETPAATAAPTIGERSAPPASEPIIKVVVEPKQASKVKALLAVPANKVKKSTSSGSNSDAEIRVSAEAEHVKGAGSSDSKSSAGPSGNGQSTQGPGASVKQVYDTSAKQRVPSWCDRVLWRSNVPMEEEADGDDPEAGVDDRRRTSRHDAEGLGGRMTQALANVFGSPFNAHLNRQRAESVSFATEERAGATPLANGAPARARGPSEESRRPAPSIVVSEADVLNGNGKAHLQPRLSPIRRLFPSRQRLTSRLQLSLSSAAHLSTSHLPTSAKSGVKPSAASHELPGRHRSISVVDLRHSPNDAGFPAPSGPRSAPIRPDSDRYTAQVGPDAPLPIAPAGTSDRDQSSQRAPGRNPLAYTRSLGGLNLPSSSSGGGEHVSSPRRLSWWETHIAARLIPSFLTSSASAGSGEAEAGDAATSSAAGPTTRPKLIGPRKGQVQCLEYRSLGDREMVELKARSDHRAVIWIGAVGV